MEQPKFKLLNIEGEQLVALTINDYTNLWWKIGNLEGEILGYKLQEKGSSKNTFEKILYMQYGKINLAGATWGSDFTKKIKQYKFNKEDLVVLHISIPEDNIVSFVNIEPITQKGIQQIIKDADNKKGGLNSSQP